LPNLLACVLQRVWTPVMDARQMCARARTEFYYNNSELPAKIHSVTFKVSPVLLF